MTPTLPQHALQLRSLITPEGQLQLSLETVPVPEPGPGQVLVRIEASPVNPSDQGTLFGAADLAQATLGGTDARPVMSAPVPAKAMPSMASRLGQALPVGNEAAGTVVAAGTAPAAQALLGRRVAILGGEMYAQFRCIDADACLLLPADASAADGASCFINPLTALGMVETMRREGHKALVHTAAASNLGRMLVRICKKDGIGLVNIVRSAAQVKLLKDEGAEHVVDSSQDGFADALKAALVATGATLAFDATGGGPLAGQILSAMEAALTRDAKAYNRYGSPVHKQVYLYGGLDPRPTEIVRSFGMAWGVGGWLVFPYLQKLGPEAMAKLKQRVADELTTTFRSHYTQTVTLQELLQPHVVARIAQRATGEKFLLQPNEGGTPA